MDDSALITTLGALLEDGHLARLRVAGHSMHPTIRDGETIILDRPDTIRRGDVILYEAPRGLTAHRVDHVARHGLLVLGDAAARNEIEIVPPSKVLGRALAVERDGAERPLRGVFRRKIDLAIAAAYRLRRRLASKSRPLDSFDRELRDFLARILEGDSPDWPAAWRSQGARVLRNLEDHGLIPIVHWHASEARAFQTWPRDVRKALRTIARGSAAAEARRTAELVRTLGRFESAGIEAILLKGIAVANLFYEESWLRPMADVDILISHTQLASARKTLRSLEYLERPSAGEGSHTQLTFVREADGARHVLDVHWSLSNTPVLRDVLTWEEAKHESIIVPGLARAKSLSPVHLLLHACVHRVGHHGCSNRLLWLIDIHRIWNGLSCDERERFWNITAEKGVRRICSDSILAAERWLSEELADPAIGYLPPEALAREEASARLLSAPTRRGARVVLEWKTIKGARPRVRWLISLLFPSSGFMLSLDGKHSRLLLPWLYLKRLVRAPLRLARRTSATDPLGSAGADPHR